MKKFERGINALPLVLLAIALVTGGFEAWMLDSSSVTAFRDMRTVAQAAAVRASVLWMLAGVLDIVVLFWNAFAAGAIVAGHLGSIGRKVTATAACLAMLAGGVLAHTSAMKPGSIMSMVNDATHLPINRTSVVSGTIFGGAAVLIIAAAVALGRRAPGALSAAELRLRIGEARLFLFSTAALLASTLSSIFFTIVWPCELPAAAGSHTPVALLRPLAVTITLASGIFYTAVLIILFVPVAIVHECWIEESWIATSAEAAGLSRAKWLSDNGLDRSLPATAAQIVAIAAPWLAAIGLPKLH